MTQKKGLENQFFFVFRTVKLSKFKRLSSQKL